MSYIFNTIKVMFMIAGGILIAALVISALIIFLPIDWLLRKVFPKSYGSPFRYEDNINMPQLCCWGQNYDDVSNHFARRTLHELKVKGNVPMAHFPVKIAMRDQAKIDDLLNGWNKKQQEITEKTQEYFQRNFEDMAGVLSPEIKEFLLYNFFRVTYLEIAADGVILDCDVVFDQEHGMSICVMNDGIKVMPSSEVEFKEIE